MTNDPALDERRAKLGVPADIAGCHTAVLEDSVIERHVPSEDILRFLAEKPERADLQFQVCPWVIGHGNPGASRGLRCAGIHGRWNLQALCAPLTAGLRWIPLRRHAPLKHSHALWPDLHQRHMH